MRHLLISAALLGSACTVQPVQQGAAPVPPAPLAAAPVPPPSQPVALVAPPPAVVPTTAVAASPPPAAVPAPAVPAVVAGSPSPGVAELAIPPLGIALDLPVVPNPIYSFLPEPVPGRLTLSNFSFDHAQIETVVTASSDCYTPTPSDVEDRFELPLNGTRIVTAPPGLDVCWRRKLDANDPPVGVIPGWTDWNRAFVAHGTRVSAKL